MIKIIKNCPKHGSLTENECFIRIEKRWGNTPKKSFSCKFCKKESSDKYRNREEIKIRLIQKSKENRIKFKERDKSTKKIYREKNREKINCYEQKRRKKNIDKFREKMRNIQKKWRDDLNENYIKSQLRSKYKIKQKDVPNWMVEIKREIIKLRRKIREMKNENN